MHSRSSTGAYGPSAQLSEAGYQEVFREHWWAAVAVVARAVKDIGAAEDSVQDACIAALAQWPARGVPGNPKAWLIGVAQHKALDRIRRESRRADKELSFAESLLYAPVSDELSMIDDQLALILTCCHPSLDPSLQVALTLRAVCGLTTAEIASAFLVPEATMAKRLVRGKQKIRDAGISLAVPPKTALGPRLNSVLKTIYLIFTQGHMASSGPDLVRTNLCDDAIRVARALQVLMPQESEVAGLAALLLLTDSRRLARTDSHGHLVMFEDQNRALWNRGEIDEGLRVLESALVRGEPGPYQLWAAIAACHVEAERPELTDWRQIVALYDELLVFEPTDVVRANRAVAVAMIDGPAAGLGILNEIAARGQLDLWPQLHIARAELLRKLHHYFEAEEAYSTALELDPPHVEKAHILRRQASVRAAANRRD